MFWILSFCVLAFVEFFLDQFLNQFFFNNFLDQFFGIKFLDQILWIDFFLDIFFWIEVLDKFFGSNFLHQFFFRPKMFLTIASFRIGIPSILFFFLKAIKAKIQYVWGMNFWSHKHNLNHLRRQLPSIFFWTILWHKLFLEPIQLCF